MTTDSRERFRSAATEERPDLALLCLLIGSEASTSGTDADGGAGAVPEAMLDAAIDTSQIELDRLAGELPAELRAGGDPQAWAEALRQLLGEKYGFHGTAADYRRLESSLLQAVLIRRRGLPILLSVIWLEVARRAGAPVYGVALPGHFVVGFGDPAGHHVLVDPFGGGRLLSAGELELLVGSATGQRRPVSHAMLQPADPLETVLRILNNIRAWAAARPEHTDVQLWALDLSLLLPHHPVRLRLERAQLLVERGDFVGGAQGLEEYAEVIAAMEPNAADTVRRQARAARARLN